MRGVWGISCDWVHVESSDDLTCKSSRAATTVDPPDRRGGVGHTGCLYRQRGARRCPVEGCPGDLATRTAMQVQFLHRHVQDTVVMLEEGNLPHARCPRCDMQVYMKALNGRHLGNAPCKNRVERKRRRLAKTETRENSQRAFHAYKKTM